MQIGELVGQGSAAQIFACGEGRVLKLYFRAATRTTVAEEAHKTDLAWRLGFPAPRVHDVLEIEGRHGFVMDRLIGPTMVEVFITAPGEAPQRARSLAELHAALTRLPGDGLPQLESRLRRSIAEAPLPDAEREAVQRCLDACPAGNSFYHGDFHPLNVLSTERGLFVIDWYNAACAHPSADIASTYLLLTVARLADVLPPQAVLVVQRMQAAVDAAYLERYLEVTGVTRDQVRSWMRPLAASRLAGAESAGLDRDRLMAIATGKHLGV